MMRRRKNNFISWFLEPFIDRRGRGHEPDFFLLIIIGILLFLGLLFLSSASSTLAFYKFHDSYYFVKQQLNHLLIGLVAFYIAFRINYNSYRKWTLIFLLGSFILLLLVFFTNLNNDYGTAKSWISFGGFSFQPSELVKLFFILFLAGWLDKLGRRVKYLPSGTIPFVVVLAIISLLIIKQPDIGTLSIIVLIALAMYFTAGAKIKHLLAIISAGLVLFFAMIKAASYRMNRFIAWLNPDIDPKGIGWQIKQSLIAIGSGGWFGVGLGSSRQKSYLPQPANDSIFSIIAEEIGFVFTLVFLILFAALMYRGFQIAKHSPDNFAKLISIGITVWLSAQIFINIAGMLQLLPLTGVPLSFISSGGSNLVVTLVAMGILINISKFTIDER